MSTNPLNSRAYATPVPSQQFLDNLPCYRARLGSGGWSWGNDGAPVMDGDFAVFFPGSNAKTTYKVDGIWYIQWAACAACVDPRMHGEPPVVESADDSDIDPPFDYSSPEDDSDRNGGGDWRDEQ